MKERRTLTFEVGRKGNWVSFINRKVVLWGNRNRIQLFDYFRPGERVKLTVELIEKDRYFIAVECDQTYEDLQWELDWKCHKYYYHFDQEEFQQEPKKFQQYFWQYKKQRDEEERRYQVQRYIELDLVTTKDEELRELYWKNTFKYTSDEDIGSWVWAELLVPIHYTPFVLKIDLRFRRDYFEVTTHLAWGAQKQLEDQYKFYPILRRVEARPEVYRLSNGFLCECMVFIPGFLPLKLEMELTRKEVRKCRYKTQRVTSTKFVLYLFSQSRRIWTELIKTKKSIQHEIHVNRITLDHKYTLMLGEFDQLIDERRFEYLSNDEMRTCVSKEFIHLHFIPLRPYLMVKLLRGGFVFEILAPIPLPIHLPVPYLLVYNDNNGKATVLAHAIYRSNLNKTKWYGFNA